MSRSLCQALHPSTAWHDAGPGAVVIGLDFLTGTQTRVKPASRRGVRRRGTILPRSPTRREPLPQGNPRTNAQGGADRTQGAVWARRHPRVPARPPAPHSRCEPQPLQEVRYPRAGRGHGCAIRPRGPAPPRANRRRALLPARPQRARPRGWH